MMLKSKFQVSSIFKYSICQFKKIIFQQYTVNELKTSIKKKKKKKKNLIKCV